MIRDKIKNRDLQNIDDDIIRAKRLIRDRLCQDEDVIEVLGRDNLSHTTLKNYHEKWNLFIYDKNYLSKEKTRDGIRGLSLAELDRLAKSLGISIDSSDIKIPGTKTVIRDPKDKRVYTIWEEIAKRL